MPVLKQIDCSIELGPAHVKLPEYGTLVRDGYIETFVAVPDASIPFTIHIASKGYIHSGLAFFVFIDGEYQCNRNRIELKTPGRGISPKDYEVEFHLRQKEEKTAESRFVAREWTFEKLDRVNADKASTARKSQYVENVGSVEVVVLRCQSDEPAPPPRLMPTQQHKTQATLIKTKRQEHKKEAKAVSTREEASEIGGLIGLFDGAYDNFQLDGPRDNEAGEPESAEPPQTTQDLEWDPIMGEYKLPPQYHAPAGVHQSPAPSQQYGPPFPEMQHAGDYGILENSQAHRPTQQAENKPEEAQGRPRRRVVFETGDEDEEEEISPPGTADFNELRRRFRAVLNNSSPYTCDEEGLAQIREDLNIYKHHLRNFKKRSPVLYAESIDQCPSIQQIETWLEVERRRLGLDLEPAAVAQAAEDSATDDPATEEQAARQSALQKFRATKPRVESQVFTDGAYDDRQYGQHAANQPVPNNIGWQEIGQGNASFRARPPRQTFAQGPVRYNQAPMQFYQDRNGNIIPVGPAGNQGYREVPQGDPNGMLRATGRYHQPNVHFTGGRQHPGQGAGPPTGYPQGNMARGGFQQQSWAQDNQGRLMNITDIIKNDPMCGDPWEPPESQLPGNYVDSRYKDVSKWDNMCQEWQEERERKGIPGDPTINNKRFIQKVEEEERKLAESKNRNKSKKRSKSKSSHGFGQGDGDANQHGWNEAAWGKNDNNNGNAATAAWDDTRKKSSGRGAKSNQANEWNDAANKDDQWATANDDNQAAQWDNMANKGTHWGNANNAWEQDNKQDDTANAWGNDGNGRDSNHGTWAKGSNNNDKNAESNSQCVNDNDEAWGNRSQTKGKTASQWSQSPTTVQDTRPTRRRKDDVTSKAHIKPYFNDWNKLPANEDPSPYKKRDTPREAYKYPALPPPAIPSDKAKDRSYGVQAGKGADYSHKCRCPVYIDSMEQPYAVFTFKYRSKKVVESILKVKVDEIDIKKILEQIEYEKLLQNPNEQLAAELAHTRMRQARQRAPQYDTNKANHGWSNHGGSAVKNDGWAQASVKSSSHRGGGWGADSKKSASNRGNRAAEWNFDGEGGSPNTGGAPCSWRQMAEPANDARGDENKQSQPARAGLEVWKPDVGEGERGESPREGARRRSDGAVAGGANKDRGAEKATPALEVVKTGPFAGMRWLGDHGPVSPPRSVVTNASSLFW